MAKINAYGNHQVGPTYFTERDFTLVGFEGEKEVINEAFRIRSDNMVQSRIVSVTNVATGETRKHSSSFRNLGTLKSQAGLDQADLLAAYIQRGVDTGRLRVVKTR